jgi:hypothetical protein
MSIIIDGMDQNHSKLPHLSSNVGFTKPMDQHIQGVLEHGQGVTFYRTFHNLPKNANLAIYCVLAHLESWRQRHKAFPETIYLQVDGGAENANKYLLGMLELLVSKRIVKEINFCRLPVGHTHEDIDAAFGVIWEWFKSKIVDDPYSYKSGIETAFGDSNLKAKVVDLFAIPDYKSLLRPCLDTKLARLHNLSETQHHWKFEAVTKSEFFPFGCKDIHDTVCCILHLTIRLYI